MERFAVFLFLLCACHGFLTIKMEVHDRELSVVLPCQYSVLLEDILTVKWSRLDPNPQTIYLLQEGKDLNEQNQFFSGRTSMRPDALDAGDFSLTLREPQLSDSGNYICSISDEREEIILSDVQLQVRGGTIDITVHKILDGGALKELHKASGKDLGGQTVDRKFKEFLREIFSHGVWDEYEENYPSEVQKNYV